MSCSDALNKFLHLCTAQHYRSLVEQSEAGRDALVQQLQTSSESLLREKTELAEKLGALEQQLAAQSDARVALEKELEEIRGKLNETVSQGVHLEPYNWYEYWCTR